MRHTFKTLALAAAIGVGLSPAALGEGTPSVEHSVVILGDAFFPRVTYANPGDTIRFQNATDNSVSLLGEDTTWVLGPISAGSEGTFTAFPGMRNGYYSFTGSPPSSPDFDNAPRGAVSFNDAPLGG